MYRHEGFEEDDIVLCELVTDRVCRAICPSGYRGRAGELWYDRVLPPPATTFDVHVVFTTPYRAGVAQASTCKIVCDESADAGEPVFSEIASANQASFCGEMQNAFMGF